jgi:UTP-glucose-1-phosphate uridylyltransferase
MKFTDQEIFDDLETSQNNGEHERLQKSRINQRCVTEPIAESQILGHEHELGEHQGIDQCESM